VDPRDAAPGKAPLRISRISRPHLPTAALLGLVLALGFGLALSCSGSPPELFGVSWELEVEASSPALAPVERLSFALSAQDRDGTEDLGNLYVAMDNQRLFWKLDPGSWVRSGAEGVVKIGYRALKMADDSSMPRGEYRFILVDKSGERAESRVMIAPPPSKGQALPSIALKDGSIILGKRRKETRLLVYDRSGSLLRTIEANRDRYTLGELLPKDAAAAQGSGTAQIPGAARLRVVAIDSDTKTAYYSASLELPESETQNGR
jgi:hypothetical protein